MNRYDHKEIEPKWQKIWEKEKVFEASDTADKPKFYSLIEFPYPSGEGMHMGHLRSNTAMDIISRKRRSEGYDVLYPIGWDAFGLPTENYAIKTGKQPSVITRENTDTFRRQLKSAGFSFDWSREVNTTDPEYYKWTQWIFLQFFKKNLAYKKKMAINWCPKDKIGLANEEVINGCCERCGGPVEKRDKDQWMLAITKYADRLDKDLDTVNYLENIKTQQRNWIGRSEGAEFTFKVSTGGEIKVFTTRADTLFGVTYVVLAPEHVLVAELLSEGKNVLENKNEVTEYVARSRKESEIDRTDVKKEKTGVELKGIKAINPANGEEVSVWIADYVLDGYGTGAVMAVPAHDERDFAFAKKYGLEIKEVIEPYFTGKPGDKDTARPDKKTVKRKTAYALVYNKKNNSFLCLDWGKFGWHSGIIGGVDEGESFEEAALREIREETGYSGVKFVRDLGGEQHNVFFAAHKDENRYAVGQGMLFELVDEKRDEVLEEHTKNHKPVWIKAEEMGKWLNLSSFTYMWSVYESGMECFVDDGILVNSGKFDGKNSEEARREITAAYGEAKVTYKLKDWIFSRQRYWGEPIPLVYCEHCAQKDGKDDVNAGWVAVPEKDLPVTLPQVENYQPTDTGESPLSSITDWVNTKCPVCGGPARRETDTMPNWAGSSWYYLRYSDPKNTKEFASPKLLKKWTPVDWYNGGMEHTTLHLLYSRFWHKFLFDLGLVPTSEPYAKRTAHGLILAADGEKMSKSKGNGALPDEFISTYGADALRLYEMFMGPFDQAVSWNNDGIVGTYRFLERFWRLQEKVSTTAAIAKKDPKIETLFHQTIAKVSGDIEDMHFNTAVSAMMILTNEFEKLDALDVDWYRTLMQLMAPFAPHIAEELWTITGNKGFVHESQWPKPDNSKMENRQVTVMVQVNGKVRSEFEASAGISENEAKNKAISDINVKKYIENKEIKRVIFVPNRLINIVLED